MIFSWFCSSIPTVICRFPLLIISMSHFYMQNFIPISWLHITIACIRVSSYFSFLSNSLIPSMYIWWFVFSCDLVSLKPPIYFLCMRSSLLQIIMVIAHLPGIYISGFSPQLSFFLLLLIQLHRFFNGFLDKLFDFFGYLVRFKTVYYSVLRDHIVFLFALNRCYSKIFRLVLLSLTKCWLMFSWSSVRLVYLLHRFYF